MLVNVAFISIIALAFSGASARQSLRPRADSADLWKDFETAECRSSVDSSNMQSPDLPELLDNLAKEKDVVLPTGGSTDNTQVYYCRSAALIFSNDGDSDKKLVLKKLAYKLTEASAKLDRCGGKRDHESEFFETVSNDDEEIPMSIWIRGPDQTDGPYWDSHSAGRTASDEGRVHKLCDYPEDTDNTDDDD